MQHAARPVPNSPEADAAAGISRPARVTLDKMAEHLVNNDRKAVRMSMLMLVQFLPDGHPELVHYQELVKQWDAEEALQNAAAEKAARENAAAEKAAAEAAAAKAAAEKNAADKRAAAERAAAQRAVVPRGRPASGAAHPAPGSGRRPASAAGSGLRPGPNAKRPAPPGHTPTGGAKQPDDDINSILNKINLDDPVDDPLRMPSGTLNVELKLEDEAPKKEVKPVRSDDVPVLDDIGSYSVFVHGVPADKRAKAIELIIEFRKCSKSEAEDLVKRTVVPVVKNVAKKTADNALSKFSREGIKGRLKQER